MNIAVYGAGSLGTIMGAYLSSTNENVDLIDTYDEHVNTLNSKGATIEGTDNFHISVNALKPNEINQQYDLILLLTKQTYNKDVLPVIKNILKKTAYCYLYKMEYQKKLFNNIFQERTLLQDQ